MSKKYDVIVIGAGIGGLVCSLYLAKAGLKILLIEKQNKPGGYCTSFKRGDFCFDVGVHYLGSCRPGGEINKILVDFSLEDKIKFNRIDPCDRIVLPDITFDFWSDAKKTKECLMESFPSEKEGIEGFFEFVLKSDFYHTYRRTKDVTFRDVLDSFFSKENIKRVFSALLGNVGLPSFRVSALTAILLFKEYIFDPGYYPINGIQEFPDLLMEKFRDYGGEVRLSECVSKICCNGDEVQGVETIGGETFFSDIVVSNSDATRTFSMIEGGSGEKGLLNAKEMTASTSAFIAYLGLNENIEDRLERKCTTWYFQTSDVDECYDCSHNVDKGGSLPYVILTFPSIHSMGATNQSKTAMSILFGARFETENFWQKNKESFFQESLVLAERIVPGLVDMIEVKVLGTPQDLHRFTYNAGGAMYGWEATPAQIQRKMLPQKCYIKNLYFAGHWATSGLGQSGIPVVAISGKNTAKMILSKHRRGVK